MTEADGLMNAVVRYRPLPATDPESLVDARVPRPVPTGHDVLVKVEAVSVNPADVQSRGHGIPTPQGRILGYDGAGTVIDTGPDVTLFRPGDQVWWAGQIDRPGSNADFQLVDERITAGVTTVATSSTPDGDRWVRSLGADAIVNHSGDLAAQLDRAAPAGVDWIFTSHSKGQIDLYAHVLKPFGHIVAIDNAHGQDFMPLKAKSIAWHWELMFTRPQQHTPDMIEQHNLLGAAADLVDAGRLRSTLTQRLTGFDAATLREAHAAVETGGTIGKVVVAR